MNNSTPELTKAMNKAKIQLMATPNSAFFTTLCFSLKHEWSQEIPTAGTNGLGVIYNPDFFMSLSERARVSLLLHETLHVALLHTLDSRRAGRDPHRWNVAGDYVINDMLAEKGFEIPDTWLHDVKYRGWMTEAVYNSLPEQTDPAPMQDLLPMGGSIPEKADPQGDGSAGAQGTVTTQPPNITEDELKQQIDDMLRRAAMQAQMAGNAAGSIPGQLQFYIDSLANPKLPWYKILRKFMRSMSKNNYTFRKPNRRFFPDHILPTAYSENLNEIAVAVDTSCSVTDEQFRHFLNETYSILKMLKPKKIHFIQFDTKIRSITELKKVADFKKLEFVGRGGTNIKEVMEWARDKNPTALLMFTDGYFHFPDVIPTCPLIWVIHSNDGFTAPKGKVIEYKFQETA